MKPQFRILGKRNRLQVREIARHSFNVSNGVEADAKTLAEKSLRAAPKSIIASLLIGVAIKLAVELIVYWIKNRFATVPSGGFLDGEPGS